MHTRTIPTTIALLSLSMTSLVALAPVAAADVYVGPLLPHGCQFGPVLEGFEVLGGAVRLHRCGIVVDPDALPDVPDVPHLGAPDLPEGTCDHVEFLLFEPNC